MARGLVVTLAPPRPRKAKPRPTILRKPGGTGILMPRGAMASARPAPRTLALPLLDPLRPFRPAGGRHASGIPRISLPGVTAPFPVTPRRPPAPDDLLDATRLALRLQALGAALDDLPDRQSASPAGARESRPAARAASGRCVRAARPASAPPAGARTRCTRSCTTSTASPSTSWSIPTRRDTSDRRTRRKEKIWPDCRDAGRGDDGTRLFLAPGQGE